MLLGNDVTVSPFCSLPSRIKRHSSTSTAMNMYTRPPSSRIRLWAPICFDILSYVKASKVEATALFPFSECGTSLWLGCVPRRRRQSFWQSWMLQTISFGRHKQRVHPESEFRIQIQRELLQATGYLNTMKAMMHWRFIFSQSKLRLNLHITPPLTTFRTYKSHWEACTFPCLYTLRYSRDDADF